MLKNRSTEVVIILLALVLLLQFSSITYAITDARDIKDIGIKERLGDYVPSNLTFYDEAGKRVELGEFFRDEKPVILTLNYYKCPTLCSYVLNGVLNGVNELNSLTLGKDFRIVTVSFNPTDTSELAKAKSRVYQKSLENSQSDKQDWHFLTGNQENINKILQAVGFKIKKDGEEFAHPSAIVVLTPQAQISRYLYGVQFEPKDLRLALLEASDGKIGSSELINKVMLFCYQFDPVGRKYTLQALNVMKAGGVLTLLSVAGIMAYFWRREKESK
jgi:protein SCO1/2